MAAGIRGKLFEPLDRREVLYAPDADPAALAAHGRAYLEQGFLCDALDFFEQARDAEGLEEIFRRASESADYFLLDRCLRALGRSREPGEWKEMGDRAAALGRQMDAYRCYLRAGLQAQPPAVEPVTPAPRTRYEPPSPSDPGSAPVVDSSADY